MTKSNQTPRYVFFDLDHTLIPMDSDFAWGSYTADLGWVDRESFFARSQAFYAQYQAGTMDIHAYIDFATHPLRSRSTSECADALANYIATVIEPKVLPQAIALVERHRAQGDTLVLVTATNAFVASPIARLFGIDHLIAVELEKDADSGQYTGAIAGTPSFREGKVTRVHQWFHARGERLEGVESVFYSDSINDLPLLQMVNTAVATNPDPTLRNAANANGWAVLDIF